MHTPELTWEQPRLVHRDGRAGEALLQGRLCSGDRLPLSGELGTPQGPRALHGRGSLHCTVGAKAVGQGAQLQLAVLGRGLVDGALGAVLGAGRQMLLADML